MRHMLKRRYEKINADVTEYQRWDAELINSIQNACIYIHMSPKLRNIAIGLST